MTNLLLGFAVKKISKSVDISAKWGLWAYLVQWHVFDSVVFGPFCDSTSNLCSSSPS